MFEIYEVPNGELDGTEVYLDEAEDRNAADMLYDNLAYEHAPIWMIKCSDKNGYEKVVCTVF